MSTPTTIAPTTIAHKPNGLLTAAEVADAPGLPANTIRSWVRAGLVRSLRFGPRKSRIALERSVINQLRREV